MRKKSWLLLVLALLVTVVLVACGEDNEEQGSEMGPALANSDIRKAIALSIDRQGLVDVILANGSTISTGAVPADFSAHPETGEDFREINGALIVENKAKAQEHWQAGLDALGIDSLELRYLGGDSEVALEMDAYIKNQLETNLEGLTVTISSVPFEERLARDEASNYDIQNSGWGPDYLDPNTWLEMWTSTSPYMTMNYHNPDYDALINEANNELLTKPVERFENFLAAERILMEDAAIAPLYQRARAYLWRPNVEGVVTHPMGADFSYKWAYIADEAEQVLNLPEASQIPTMDSSHATDAVAFQFLNESMEGLYRLDENSLPVPGVAVAEPEISEDGLTWTIQLRDDAVWSNGAAVTAHDFVFAWRRAVDPDIGSEYGPFMMNGVIKNAEAINNGEVAVEELGVEATSDTELVITLEKPIPYFHGLLAFGTFLPLNEEFVTEQGDNYALSSDNLLYNGPFILEDWNPTGNNPDQWKLVKNPDYWDAETVSLEEINVSVVKETSTRVNLYTTGDIDRAALSSEYVEQYIGTEDYRSVPEATLFYLKMNQGTKSE